MFYKPEDSAERRERRDRAIKALFQQLVINENMPVMEAYEAVGYVFYLSERQVRKIIMSLNKKWNRRPQSNH